MDLSISSSLKGIQPSPQESLATLIANGALLARTRAGAIEERKTWLSAEAYHRNHQSATYPNDAALLERYRLEIEKSLCWKEHTPIVAKLPLLPRFAARASVPLTAQHARLGSLLINSFMILKKMQEHAPIEYNFASNALRETIDCWQQYNTELAHWDENTEEGVNILSAFLWECDSSKKEKMSLLAGLSQLIPQETDDAQKMAAHAHVLGFIFENSARVVFDSIKFLEACAPLFQEWIAMHAQFVKNKDFYSYYRAAYSLCPKSDDSLKKLESVAIDCLWAQRRYNLLVHPHRYDQKIVVMGFFSLASLTALIEAAVAGYVVVSEKASQIRSSSKFIRIAAPSMIEALYRYGIASRILTGCRASDFPVCMQKFVLQELLLGVLTQFENKIRESERMSPWLFLEPKSLEFMPSEGLCEAASRKAFPCKAIVLAGSRKPDRLSGLSGLRLPPLEVLYMDKEKHVTVTSERAFFLAGTKIAVFLVGGMEHQAFKVVRENHSIAIVRQCSLFADHWGDRKMVGNPDLCKELCAASMERWLAQSYPFVFCFYTKNVPRSIFIEKFLYQGLINESQINALRMLAILADPSSTASVLHVPSVGNASNISPRLIKYICDLASPIIDTLSEHLTKLIDLEQYQSDEAFSKTVSAKALIRYLALQQDFIKNLLRHASPTSV